MSFKCDICGKAIKITPTVNHKIQTDGLLVYCKKCWTAKGIRRDRFTGQIQQGIYLSTT